MTARRRSETPPPPGDEEATRQSALPPEKDEIATRQVEDSGAIAELHAAISQNSVAKTEKLALYTLPDQIVVGRGSAADWQLDDDSLSRKHCQFRWNGRELTVEDLGSANGTKLNSRPVHKPSPVKPGDLVQLGTVVISLHPRGAAAAASPGRANPDDLSTRLVSSPELRPEDQGFVAEGSDSGITPTPAPLPPQPTILRPAPSSAADNPNAPVFRPPSNALGPDEQTRAWDPSAVLVKQKDPPLDWRHLWKTQRRPIVLGAAALWVGILLLLLSLVRSPAEEAPFATPLATNDKAAKPVAAPVPENDTPPAPVDPADRGEVLSQAVASFDQGRLAESLVHWRRLAASSKSLGSTTDLPETGAHYMVQLIEARLRAAGDK